jgi:hypothetical protein
MNFNNSKLEQFKAPNVIINKELGKYKDVVLFPKKVEEANRILKTVGLPKVAK